MIDFNYKFTTFTSFPQTVNEGAISKFSETYRNLNNMSVTPNIHIIEHHIIDSLKRKQEEHGLVGGVNRHLKPCTVI